MKLFHVLIVLTACFLHVIPVRPETAQSDKTGFDTIYCRRPINFYDQESIYQLNEFIGVAPEAQNELLLKQFAHKRAIAYMNTFKETGLKMLPLLPVTWGLYRYRHVYRNIPGWMGFGGVIGFARLLEYPATAISLSIRDFVNVLIKMYTSNSQDLSRLEKLELEYVINKRDISEEYQAILEDRLIQAYCPNGGSILSGNNEYETKESQKVIAALLKLPRKNKEISYNRKKINSTLQGYAGATLQDLKRYCIRHVAASRSESVRKIAAYFYGEPGVGKTRAAKQMAQGINTPLEIITLADITIDKLIGTEREPGLLLTALMRGKFKNMLLLIDEADRVLLDDSRTELLSFILTLLDSETKSFYSPYLGTEVDISHIGIILTGNSEITDAALKNRLHIVKFDGYQSSYKKSIMWSDFFPEQLALYEKAEFALTEEDFCAADREAINKLVDEDTDAGFRSIKLKLMTYFEDKVLEKYFTDSEFDPAFDYEDDKQLYSIATN